MEPFDHTHRGTSRPTVVKGVVIQSYGIFHFTGFLSEHSTLQAMLVPNPPIGSRVVLRRSALSTADAVGKCGEVPMQAALDLG